MTIRLPHKAVFRFHWLTILALLCSCLFTGNVWAWKDVYCDGGGHDEGRTVRLPETTAELCEEGCNWDELQKQYVTQWWKDEIGKREGEAAAAGAPLLFTERCLANEWACQNGYDPTLDCTKINYVNPDTGMSAGIRIYNLHAYPDGPPPLPSAFDEKDNQVTDGSDECGRWNNRNTKQFISAEGMKGVAASEIRQNEKYAGDCNKYPCSQESRSATAYLRAENFDFTAGFSQQRNTKTCYPACLQGEPAYNQEECEKFQIYYNGKLTAAEADAVSAVTGFAAWMVQGARKISNMIKTGQVPESGEYHSPVPQTGEAVAIVIEGMAEGFARFEDTLYTEDFAPSTVTLHGFVKDVSGKPLAGAKVSLPGLGASVQSNTDGSYRIEAAAGGDKPFESRFDLIMQQEIGTVTGKVDEASAVYANGREVTVRLQVQTDGKPYADKPVHVIQTSIFKVGERETDLLELNRGVSVKVQTDAQGRADVTLVAPGVKSGAINPEADSQWLFPATGFLELRGEWDSLKQILVPYTIANPFPIIRKLVVTGNIDEENWQLTPARVYIDDPDSEGQGGWTVTAEAAGSLKTRYGNVYEGRLMEKARTSPFEFYYRPPKIGMDLNKQPELGKALIETNLKIALGEILGALENKIGKLPKDQAILSLPGDIKTALNAAKTGLSYLDQATNAINVVASDKPASTGDALLQGFDYVFSLTETALGLLGGELSLHQKAAKAAYENAKVFYAVFQGYETINNAFQDVIFMPITVTVEDELGHTTKKTGRCAVKVWTAMQ